MPLSSFHPAVRSWFETKLGAPTKAQERGWAEIRRGHHTLIAAPTGSGKTLAAFLSAIDGLLAEPELPDETRVLYISPLKALASDIRKNLEKPLAEIRALDPTLADVRVVVRTGDTQQKTRASTVKRPPHVLVTTPESLYILLTSESGRKMLKTVRTVIVDEIHALARDKRGAHLALSLERLEALCGKVQRIGLSATQKPLSDMGHFLVGKDRACALVDEGHLRTLDLAVELPPSPLSAVCSHEVWEEIYARMTELVSAHRTTLVFVNTRKMAERIAARLGTLLGQDVVTCHHGSLSADRRLDAETRLKEGQLRALVATASLELGIDIGDVDLVLQIGGSRSIATLLQRVGRAGHGVGRVPKGRLFPLTRDELVEAQASLDAIGHGVLDRILQPAAPLDILAQQIVAAASAETWSEDALFTCLTKAWPYRDLSRETFDETLSIHARGRLALLHRDGVGGNVRGTRRARLVAITGGGAIPDNADYRVVIEPEGHFLGTLNEDFAIESNAGDIFQLGTASWQILRVEPGVVRVADAKGAPPTIPFWLGEAPARTTELSREISNVRAHAGERTLDAARPFGVTGSAAVAEQIVDYVLAGRKALGVVPTQEHVVLERFFDESGGMQVVLHAPFGARINRAWGLSLRKRFCRSFGFELQAAANDEAIVFSLGEQHSFPLDEVFDYLHPSTAKDVLVQALLAAPMFKTRWRWNASRSLMLERTRGGKRVPPPILRMRSEDLLASTFPATVACPETLPPGDIEVPLDHPIVRQTLDDCLTEAMDVEGFLRVLRDLREGRIQRTAIDTVEPSVFAHGILAAQPYTFLDDAPLEERRTQAVMTRRTWSAETADDLGALDPEAIARVREEAWPHPENAEELHEALSWMGYMTEEEAAPFRAWIAELSSKRRIALDEGRWFAVEATRDPKEVLRGRMEALGPVESDDPNMLALEAEGVVVRGRFEGKQGKTQWCSRRLLARIHRYTLDRLRKEIEPVTASQFLRFLSEFQHIGEEHVLEGPRGVAEVLRQLAGFEVPVAAWEASILPKRIRNYRREWLDQLTLSGEFAWGRLWGSGSMAIRTTPIAIVPREELPIWTTLASAHRSDLGAPAAKIRELLLARGAVFPQELARASRLLPSEVDNGLAELIAAGAATCDSFAALRVLLAPPRRRERTARWLASASGRWSLFRTTEADPAPIDTSIVEAVARQLLRRTGVVFRKTIEREKLPIPWRDLLRVFRTLEARGEIRGGRFVAGFDGEQYALPEAVTRLRAVRRRGETTAAASVAAADPLNFRGILTPDAKVAPSTRGVVLVA